MTTYRRWARWQYLEVVEAVEVDRGHEVHYSQSRTE